MLALSGVLNMQTYRQVRDTVIKAALDQPRAVIVDVTELRVPTPSAWAVFTSARWHVNTWPDVPILLAHADPAERQVIVRNGVTRYVPVYADASAATDAARTERIPPTRRRSRTQLVATPDSMEQARSLVTHRLTVEAHPELIAAAVVVVTVLVENVIAHTDSAPAVAIECTNDTVTIAVEDGSTAAACVREHPGDGPNPVTGLAIIASLSRAWGNTPTQNGKVVWAVIGPENAL